MRDTRLLSAILLGFVLLATPASAFAGAWAQEDNALYAKLSYGYGWANEQYKENGQTFQLLSEDEKGSFDSQALFFYAEYGLLPKLTVIAATSWTSAAVDSELVHIRTSGTTDFRAGLRWQFLDEPFVMSVQGLASVPTGYTPDPQAAKAPTLGLGVNQYDASLMVGKSFYPVPLYVSGDVGFRFRGSYLGRDGQTVDYPHEIPYNLELGYGPADWMWLRGVLRGVEGLGDPQALDTFSLTPLTQTFTKTGPSVIVTLWEHLQLNVDFLWTVRGINALRSRELTVGVAWDGGL